MIKRAATAILAVSLMAGTMVKGHTFTLARTADSEPLTQSEQVYEWFRVALGGEERKVYTETAGMFPAESASDSLFWRGVVCRIAGVLE